jgi:AbrB family looped-hinge helix DNA binding protein
MQTTAAPTPPEAVDATDQTQPETTTPPAKTTYQVRVTRRHAITLPAELRREFDIQCGDALELQIDGDQIVLRRSVSAALDRLQGILRPYFKDHDEVRRFLEEERSGWAEREAQLEANVARVEGILADIYPTREDVQQFIDNERRGWAEREAKLEDRWKQGEQRQGPGSTSTG